MANLRAASLSRLISLRIKIERDLPLLPSERNWLADALGHAAAGDHNPFGIFSTGRPPKDLTHLKMAEAIRRLNAEGIPLNEAFRRVGEQFFVSGDYGGTAEKAYRRHLPMLQAADAAYRAMNAGRSMSEEELDALQEGLESLSDTA